MTKPYFVKTFTEFDWKTAIPKVRALHVARGYQKLGVQEDGGENKGPFIKRFLQRVGIMKPAPWCGAFVYDCLIVAGADPSMLPGKGAAASVCQWRNWAKKTGRLGQVPARYKLGYWLDGGKGHIFFVAEVTGSGVRTIEGNTNAKGSREGDAVAEKFRTFSELKTHGQYGFISLDGIGEGR